jgi:group I intron endonuclease
MNGKIYKITCTCTGKFYVGSTVDPLLTRLKGHIDDATMRQRGSKFMEYIRKHGVPFFEIELLEAYPCSSKTQLRMQEQVWQDRLKPSLNTARAYGRKKRKRTASDLPFYLNWKKKRAV